MRKIRHAIILVIAALLCATVFSSCAAKTEKPSLRAIIIPKFEIGEMSGDAPGEAQLFYEEYCAGCPEVEIPNMSKTGHFYYNEENGVGILITGSGKTAAGLSLMALFSSGLYDYSRAYIISVGCAGGNSELTTLGDVILVAAAGDFDLGHHVDSNEREDTGTHVTWFGDDSYVDYEYEVLNVFLYEKAYELIKDVPLRTTEQAKTVMTDNFPDRSPEDILPSVKLGTALSGDNFWKGRYSHDTAEFIAKYYNIVKIPLTI